MESSEVLRAIDAGKAMAVALDLAVDDATLLRNSNKLALRLLPCDVFARVGPAGLGLARFEFELARGLAAAGSPVTALEPRVDPRAYESDGFGASLWTHYETVTPRVAPRDCASALASLHAGMRTIDVPAPHFTDRVADPTANIASAAALNDADRDFLSARLRDLRRAVIDRGP